MSKRGRVWEAEGTRVRKRNEKKQVGKKQTKERERDREIMHSNRTETDGLRSGQISLLLRRPAGHWYALVSYRRTSLICRERHNDVLLSLAVSSQLIILSVKGSASQLCWPREASPQHTSPPISISLKERGRGSVTSINGGSMTGGHCLPAQVTEILSLGHTGLLVF